MSILVTGGAGLIGSYVLEELVQGGDQVVSLDINDPGEVPAKHMKGIEWIKGEIECGNFLDSIFQKHRIERVVHLAGLLQFGCEQDPPKAVHVNILGTLNLLEAARKVGVKRFVFASSAAIYGASSGTLHESSPVSQDTSLYGRSKFFGELLGSRYEKLYGLPFVVVRYFLVFGPGKVGSPGVAEVIKKIESTISGKDVTISEAISPDKKIHFVFAKDVAHGTILALKKEGLKSRIFNIAGGEDCYITLEEFHQNLKRIFPSAGRVNFTGKGPSRGKADISLAREELGYEPQYSLEKGIQEDIDYFMKV